jgi:hypothetical protein
VDLAEWRLPHRAAQLARWHRRSEIEDQEAPAYVGYLVERYRLQAAAERAHPEKWVFTLTDGSALPLWIPASGKLRGGRQRSRAAICPVSVRTLSGAPISRGGMRKARRASKPRKIASHSTVSMTEEYTKIQLGRQEELTRRIQGSLANAGQKQLTALQ